MLAPAWMSASRLCSTELILPMAALPRFILHCKLRCPVQIYLNAPFSRHTSRIDIPQECPSWRKPKRGRRLIRSPFAPVILILRATTLALFAFATVRARFTLT